MSNTNEMSLCFESKAVNEAFSRMVIAAFIAETNPTLEEVSDVKTAVSEAVTNCIIHGYENGPGKIYIKATIANRNIRISIKDEGRGIENIKQAMEPMFTTKKEEDRSGMGFSFMEAFMDGIDIKSKLGEGTEVIMWKEIGAKGRQYL